MSQCLTGKDVTMAEDKGSEGKIQGALRVCEKQGIFRWDGAGDSAPRRSDLSED